jgi:hypothetical protein
MAVDFIVGCGGMETKYHSGRWAAVGASVGVDVFARSLLRAWGPQWLLFVSRNHRHCMADYRICYE